MSYTLTMSNALRIKKSKRQKIVRRIYWPNCAVCQYMKKNSEFRLRIMQSTYFVPEAAESLAEVVHAFNDPFVLSTMYAHMQRHQPKDLLKAQMAFDKTNKLLPDPKAMVRSVSNTPGSEHEQALLEVVREGRAKLAAGEMQVNLTGLIQASKELANIERASKDRKLDAFKLFFGTQSRTADGDQGPSGN